MSQRMDGLDTSDPYFQDDGPLGEVARLIRAYVSLTSESLLVVSAWVLCAWLNDIWEEFPILAITSPEKRCGKSTLLRIVSGLSPNPIKQVELTPATLFRTVEAHKGKLTLCIEGLLEVVWAS